MITTDAVMFIVGVLTGIFCVSSYIALRQHFESMHANDDYELRYYIKGDHGDEIALPVNWTLSDALFLRDLLRRKYMVGCVILYGSERTGYDEL